MKIRKGKEEDYAKWYEKKSVDKSKFNILKAVAEIGDCLDKGGPPLAAIERLLNCPQGIKLKDLGYVALAISCFHEKGGKFRFEWNRYWCGEDWALDMEISLLERVYDPYGESK